MIDSGEHEYPDPEFVPRFPWLGSQNREASAEDLGHDPYSTRPSSPVELVSRDKHTEQSEHYTNGPGPDRSPDPDYDYREDDAKSDELISEAESDLSSNAPSSGRGRGRGRAGRLRGRGRRGRGRSGRQGRGGRGIKKGPRKPLEPSYEFKTLHSQATLAFLDHDYDKAEDYVQEAIRNNPEMFSAHALLSEIHLARGDNDRALTALFHGAHTRPRDTEVWTKVAELILERSGDDRLSGIRDAIYCYNRVIGVDPTQVEARYRRAALNLERGHKGKAAYEYERLLKLLPHDTTVLRHMAELYSEIGDTERAISHFEEAIAHYQSEEPNVVTSFTWSDVNIYGELFTYSDQPSKGVAKLKSLSRWLLGRRQEEFWDEYTDDDREFDADDQPRRKEVPEFTSGKYERSAYGEGLPLELRVKLGILRLKSESSDFKEAMNHFEWLEPEDDRLEGKLFDYPDLFRDVADALCEQKRFYEALRFFEPVQQVSDYTDACYFSGMASCYRALGLYSQAEDCYREILRNDEGNLDIRVQLVKMFEDADMPDRASLYTTEIAKITCEEMKPRKKARIAAKRFPVETSRDVPTASNSLGVTSMLEPPPAPKPPKKSASDRRIREMEEFGDLQALFLQMQVLRDKFHESDDSFELEWMRNSKILIENFRKRKVFFPFDKHVKFFGYTPEARMKATRSKASQALLAMAMIERQQKDPPEDTEDDDLSIPDEYCGITFKNWLDIFLEYGLLLTEHGEVSSAYDIISAASSANVFYHSPDFLFRIHVCWFTCALIVNDAETLCNVARFFMKKFQFVTDSYRLYTALNRLCNGLRLCFNAAPSQKYLLRQIKAMDYSLIQGDQSKTLFQERASYTMNDDDGNPVKAEELDVGLLVLYGHVLYAGTSYAFALNYYFRAYALDPTNPMIKLSLGLAYLHYALKRQSENRHYLIMQGFSFLQNYYNDRRLSKVLSEKQEAEFNMGRAYHMLGLTHLAIPYYERCLDLSLAFEEEGLESDLEDFAHDAAFTLQGIWATSGRMELAQAVTERWLVI